MKLRIELESAHPVTGRAAWRLAQAWRAIGGGGVRIGGGQGPRVRIGLGSLVRPSALVRFDVPFADPEAADQLALTIAAWDAVGGRESWRALSAPLPRVHRGTPRDERPWALSLSALSLSGQHASGPEQLHVIGGLPRRSAGDDVWWPRWPSVVAALLGRADRVLGSADPLVYDAVRAGVAVRPELAPGTLAGLVPPSLERAPELWLHVAKSARAVHVRGDAPVPLMTPTWIARGRERIRAHLDSPPSRWEQIRRRHDKLRRDPRRFFADSKHPSVRTIGAFLASRGTLGG